MTGMTREDLLRASGFAAFGLMAGGCSVLGGGGKSPAFAQLGGDAWAWEKTLTGTTDGCDDVVVRVNGKAAQAKVTGDGFEAAARLGKSGENRLEAACGDSGGNEVVYRQRLAVRPTARIGVKASRAGIELDGSGSEPTQPTGSPVATWTWSEREGNPEALRFTGGTDGETATVAAPTREGEYYVTLEVADADGNTDRSTRYFVVDGGGPRAVDMAKESPAWVKDAIVYGVVPFLFGSPPIKAVTDRLPNLARLGVNALWLGPITQPDVGDYGYAVTDYFRINDQYGTEEDLRTLVQTAHEHGIKVMMDFVPNHSSDAHPYFRHAQKNRKRSPYWTYYDRDENGDYTYYFDWQNLPNLNYDNPEVRRFMTEGFSYWVREFDVDGFRVDACWGVRERSPDFWPEFREEIKRVKPDVFLLAEATARDPWYVKNGFDVAYDWTEELGVWAWGDVFYDIPSLAQSLDDAINADPQPHKVFHFLNNNDTGARFIGTYDSDTTRVAATLLLTLPGVPCIFTGDEIGAQFDPYQDVNPIDWSNDFLKMEPTYRLLCDIRNTEPSMRAPDWTRVEVKPERSGLYAYIRHMPDGSDPVLVILNFAREILNADIALPARFAGAFDGTLRDLYKKESVPGGSGTSLNVRMTAVDARVLKARA